MSARWTLRSGVNRLKVTTHFQSFCNSHMGALPLAQHLAEGKQYSHQHAQSILAKQLQGLLLNFLSN